MKLSNRAALSVRIWAGANYIGKILFFATTILAGRVITGFNGVAKQLWA
jgi:hypothetical protein